MKLSKAGIISTAIVIIIAIIAIWGWLVLSNTMQTESAEGPWGGVDVNVIEKFATEAGREIKEPIINTDQGDLLLFVFALAGAIGGFLMGYFWRKFLVERTAK